MHTNSSGFRFSAGEITCLAIVASVTLLDIVLIFTVDAVISFTEYSLVAIIPLSLIFLGLLYRKFRKNSENIAVTFIYTGLMILFSNVGGIANYLLLGFSGEPIDEYLVQLDAMIGFNWLNFLHIMQNYPTTSQILAVAYNTSLPLISLLIVLLGFSGRHKQLHSFVLCLMIGAILTIGFWSFFPSYGTTAVYTIPPDLEASLNLVVGEDYGKLLRSLDRENIPVISPANIKGIVAFPSFHTVMALACIFYAWSFRFLKYIFLILNVLVIFAVPLHGGHHLVDVFGAVIFTAIAVVVVKLNDCYYRTNS